MTNAAECLDCNVRHSAFVCCGVVGAHAGICGMRTCGEVNPVSIDVAEPVFGWQMVTDTLPGMKPLTLGSGRYRYSVGAAGK